MAEGGEKRSPTSHRTKSQRQRHVQTYQKTEKDKARRRARNRARYAMIKEGKVARNDGKDVAHVKPLSKGGTNARSNLKVQSPKKNRGHGMSPGGRPKSRTPRKR